MRLRRNTEPGCEVPEPVEAKCRACDGALQGPDEKLIVLTEKTANSDFDLKVGDKMCAECFEDFNHK